MEGVEVGGYCHRCGHERGLSLVFRAGDSQPQRYPKNPMFNLLVCDRCLQDGELRFPATSHHDDAGLGESE